MSPCSIAIPETIELRELRFNIVESGRRTKVLTPRTGGRGSMVGGFAPSFRQSNSFFKLQICANWCFLSPPRKQRSSISFRSFPQFRCCGTSCRALLDPFTARAVVGRSKVKETTYQRDDVVVLVFRGMAAGHPFEFDSAGNRFNLLCEFVRLPEGVFFARDEE